MGDQTGKDPKQIVLRFYREVMSTGDAQLARELVSPDYHDHNTPDGAPNGPPGLVAHMQGLRRTFPDFALQTHEMVGEGEWVATRVTAQGTHLGEWMGIRPSAKRIHLKGINLDRVVHGRIVEHYGEADTLGMLVQMGVNPFGT